MEAGDSWAVCSIFVVFSNLCWRIGRVGFRVTVSQVVDGAAGHQGLFGKE